MLANKKITTSMILILAVLTLGTTGYMLIEDYSLVEGLYMSIITVTTVGFGEVQPLSESGRVFTTFIILIGFGTLAFAGHAVAESLLEEVWSSRSEIKKMKKRISLLRSHYIICGFGRVGAAAVEHFRRAGAECVIIDRDLKKIQEIKDKGYLYIEGDATQESVLFEAGIKSAGGLLALLDSDPHNLFIVLCARELNPTLHIISRAGDSSSEQKIRQAGADSVVSPFTNAGVQIAEDILEATEKSLSSNDQWGEEGGEGEEGAGPRWHHENKEPFEPGETIGTYVARTGRTVIGHHRNGSDIIFPGIEIELEESDKLLLFDGRPSITELPEQTPAENQKIVIIDDNAVIRRLFTRLFQRAGFHPLTADDGEEGLELITRIKPQVAVIDLNLPGISGMDVCRQIRSRKDLRGIKLIVFTADTKSRTREESFNAGADRVVVKSPEASELVETVVELLAEDRVNLS